MSNILGTRNMKSHFETLFANSLCLSLHPIPPSVTDVTTLFASSKMSLNERTHFRESGAKIIFTPNFNMPVVSRDFCATLYKFVLTL
jgi:hypothetical protein